MNFSIFNNKYLIFILSYILFIICLITPAITIKNDELFGWQCMQFGYMLSSDLFKLDWKEFLLVLVTLSNTIVLISPLLLKLKKLWVNTAFQIYIFLSFLLVILSPLLITHVECFIGYYLWCASFLFLNLYLYKTRERFANEQKVIIDDYNTR